MLNHKSIRVWRLRSKRKKMKSSRMSFEKSLANHLQRFKMHTIMILKELKVIITKIAMEQPLPIPLTMMPFKSRTQPFQKILLKTWRWFQRSRQNNQTLRTGLEAQHKDQTTVISQVRKDWNWMVLDQTRRTFQSSTHLESKSEWKESINHLNINIVCLLDA